MSASSHPASQKEAVDRGAKRYYTGKPCLRGHLALRHASTGGCTECQREDRAGKYRASRYASNTEYKRKRNNAGQLEYAKKMVKHWNKKVHQLLEEARS